MQPDLDSRPGVGGQARARALARGEGSGLWRGSCTLTWGRRRGVGSPLGLRFGSLMSERGGASRRSFEK